MRHQCPLGGQVRPPTVRRRAKPEPEPESNDRITCERDVLRLTAQVSGPVGVTVLLPDRIASRSKMGLMCAGLVIRSDGVGRRRAALSRRRSS
jgi:hypothetical protein